MGERADQLWTARHVAERLAVSTETVLRWTRAGKLPAVKLPSGAVRYVPEVLDAWLKSREVGATPVRDLRGVTSSEAAQPYRPCTLERDEQ